MAKLRGAHAIVTGASRGLGVRIAVALAEQGMDLTLAARSVPELEQVRELVRRHGGRAVAVGVDVTDPDDRARLVDVARTTLGPVDVLVNNAGLECAAWFADVDPDEVERVLAVNLAAPLLLTQQVLPAMLERGRGHVVNIASTAGKSGAPFQVVYSSTKAGLVGASQALRAELAGTGVSVSVVCPGFVEDEGMYARQVAEVGVRASRWIGTTTPDEVAAAVVKAIRRGAPELIVNPGPFRPLAAAAELLPALRAPVTSWLVSGVLRRVADHRREERAEALGATAHR